MKKVVLATAILGTFAAASSQAITVYSDDDSSLEIGGRAEARFNISDANESDSNSSFNDLSRARINIAGETKVNEDVSVFGFYEAELNADSSNIDNRYLFAGFDTTYGAFSYGKQDSAQVILTNSTDILYTFGGDAADLTKGNADKVDNNFVYSNTFADAVIVTLNHAQEEEKGNYSSGASVAYDLPFGLQIGAGYVDGKQDDEKAKQYNVSAAYSLNDLYLGALVTRGEIDNVDLEGYELAASYSLNHFVVQYVYNYKDVDTNNKLQNVDEVNYHAIEGAYNVSDDFTAYAGYKFDRLKTDGHRNDDQIQVGLRYDF
ncbi:porin [Enterovibrio coralii]|uniref:Porin domain-containing protein n=1 Tax=Enterovibrio coralii TaxID=294935 RepID=A0A135I7X4_9GAMM|nr:porin [Enterovibrio coralii]KXF81508.1 hypothetical protein ATN88_02020 [Enterovibrio coralii]